MLKKIIVSVFTIYFVSCSATKVFCCLCEVQDVQVICFSTLRLRGLQEQTGKLSNCLSPFHLVQEHDTQVQHLNQSLLLNLTQWEMLIHHRDLSWEPMV